MVVRPIPSFCKTVDFPEAGPPAIKMTVSFFGVSLKKLRQFSSNGLTFKLLFFEVWPVLFSFCGVDGVHKGLYHWR